MKTTTVLGAALLLFGTGLFGCSNTSEGVKQDTADNTQKVQQAADNAGAAVDKAANNAGAAVDKAAKTTAEETSHVAKNASDALTLTPKVKDAIVADSGLNDTRNTIDVDSNDNLVHLKGTVISSALKKRAGEIAAKTIKESNAKATVKNELKVQAAQ